MFAVKKRDSRKCRLISQFNKLNTCSPCPRFKPDSWKTVQEPLQNPSHCWGTTADMANWFHHPALSNKARRWARFQIQERTYEMTALPFGLASSPYWAHRLSKPILEWTGAQKLTLVWCVDNVLLLGKSAQEVETAATLIIRKQTSLGIHLNPSKCKLNPCQSVKYLSHNLDLKNRRFVPLKSKLTAAIRETKKALTGKTTTPKYLAVVAGKLL